MARAPGAGGRGPHEEMTASTDHTGPVQKRTGDMASTQALTPDPRPPAPMRQRIAPTEMREGRWMRGEVHDPRSYEMGGVAGHAGLFSTADDLARFCQMIL